MPTIKLEGLTDQQVFVANIFINEGKVQALEDLLKEFDEDYFKTAPEDPHYAYYLKHTIDMLRDKISKLTGNNQEEQ